MASVHRDSPHHEMVMSSLFGQLLPPSRNYLYDYEEGEQLASADKIVQDRLASIFALHGAIDSEPPLLMPAMDGDDNSQVRFLDRHGDVVALPNNLIHPFARLAARVQITRIKRYFMTNIYEPK
jgi:eukaryotic translation initiation factor 2-alpha kinase 4